MNSASTTLPGWKRLVAPYERPRLRASSWQIINSFGPYLLLWGLMAYTIQHSILLTLALDVLAAGFMLRVFIIGHDCGHGSLFESRRANRFWGALAGLLTLTPYLFWQHEHARHHGASGNLDRRGVGDIWTMTVQEYLSRPWWSRLSYRLYRNPLVMFGIGALVVFVVRYRVTSGAQSRAERHSVYWTNAGLLTVAVGMSAWLGAAAYLIILIPLLGMACGAGVWLFYVQHQFEGVMWAREGEWDYAAQAIAGSSFYKLPRILQWFTGSIGFHHVHHLSPRIPNYRLEQCHRENAIFHSVKAVTLLSSLKSLSLRLWDEKHKELVGFRALRAIRNPARS